MKTHYHIFDPHWQQYLLLASPNGWTSDVQSSQSFATIDDADAMVKICRETWPYRQDLYVVTRGQDREAI